MKNIEKYIDLISAFTYEKTVDCELCKLRNGSCCDSCTECLIESIKWLNAEYQEPIKLTHAEKVILENIDDCWKWITRDNVYETLGIHMIKPKRGNGYWISNCSSDCSFEMYEHLFQFIKWEDEPLEIAWLLENCEVIEDDN